MDQLLRVRGAHSALPLRVEPVPSSAQWEACRQTQEGRTFFHRWDWLHTMAAAFEIAFIPLGFYLGTSLVGVVPLLVKRRGPYKRINAVPFPYLGPLLPPSLLRQGLTALDRYQRANGVSAVEWGFAPHAHVDAAILERASYRVQRRTTYVLPLANRSAEDLWTGLKDRRWNIRQAQRSKVTIGVAGEAEVTRELPSIMDEVFAARAMPSPYPAAAALAVWDYYRDHPDVHMAVAHYDGQAVGIIITLIDGARAFMWNGSARPRFRRINASSLLYWDAICWAHARGCSAIDMVGNPDEGIGAFKARFGALSSSYVVAQRENSRLLQPSRALRDYLRRWRHAQPSG